jgi:hypothetical protein
MIVNANDMFLVGLMKVSFQLFRNALNLIKPPWYGSVCLGVSGTVRVTFHPTQYIFHASEERRLYAEQKIANDLQGLGVQARQHRFSALPVGTCGVCLAALSGMQASVLTVMGATAVVPGRARTAERMVRVSIRRWRSSSGCLDTT